MGDVVLFDHFGIAEAKLCGFCGEPGHAGAWTLRPVLYVVICDACWRRLCDGERLERNGHRHVAGWTLKQAKVTGYWVDWAAFSVKAEGWG
jgi:hypothetical protein